MTGQVRHRFTAVKGYWMNQTWCCHLFLPDTRTDCRGLPESQALYLRSAGGARSSGCNPWWSFLKEKRHSRLGPPYPVKKKTWTPLLWGFLLWCRTTILFQPCLFLPRCLTHTHRYRYRKMTRYKTVNWEGGLICSDQSLQDSPRPLLIHAHRILGSVTKVFSLLFQGWKRLSYYLWTWWRVIWCSLYF